MHTTKVISLCLILLVLAVPFASSKQIPRVAPLNIQKLVYDKNGNLIQDQNYIYEYNALNQLIKTRKDYSKEEIRPVYDWIASYTYGEDGERVKKVEYRVAGGKDETTYYIDENFIRVVNSSGTFDIIYYLQDGQIVAREENGKKFFYHSDHLGSTSIITDSSGNVIEKTEYEPFGAVLEGGSDRFLFTGQENDKGTGLLYYGARYYSPFLARFTQPDTVTQNVYDPQMLNRYAYARDNPLKYTDSTGHFLDIIADVGFIAWDIFDLAENSRSGGNWAALGLDVGFLFVPFMTGGKLMAKAATKADNMVKAADKAGDATKAAGKLDNVKDAAIKSEKAGMISTISGERKIVGINGKFPSNPAQLTEKLGIQPVLKGANKQNMVWHVSENVIIEYHPGHALSAGGTFNPRHNLQHYTVHIKKTINNNQGQTLTKWPKIRQIGIEKAPWNFLPGEEIP